MFSRSSSAVAAGVALCLSLFSIPAVAAPLEKDAAACQKAAGKATRKFQSATTKAWRGCLEDTLKGKVCDEAKRDDKIDTARTKAVDAILAKCDSSLLFGSAPAGAGFPATCALKLGELSASEQDCADLSVTDAASLADCLLCWTTTETLTVINTAYPCLEGSIADGALLQCGTAASSCPTDKAESKCVRTIAKATLDYFVAYEKELEACLDGVASGKLTGPCPDDDTMADLIAVASKLAEDVQKCDQAPTWWDVCPYDPTETCTTATTSLDAIATCGGSSATASVVHLACRSYPGADTAGIACPALPSCGDDDVNTPAEECDDGNTASEDGCSAACVTESCGDGVVQAGLGETCDDGDSNSDVEADACRTTCQPASCGDGVVDSEEECEGSAGGCNAATCILCGNGVVTGDEQCDTAGPGCPAPTDTFDVPGSYTWTVPDGIDSVIFTVRGAQGGSGMLGGPGGLGGETSVGMSVTAGTVFQLVVGGSGDAAASFTLDPADGGFNGGGDSGVRGVSGVNSGGGGGGASDIRSGGCAATQTCSLAERVLVAGGGGGGGANCGGDMTGGDGGGESGENGDDSFCGAGFGGGGGGGGTQSAGGAGGSGGMYGTAGDGGSVGEGGDGGDGTPGTGSSSGGGGGGGFFGGGGGGATEGGGGGGGRGYVYSGLPLIGEAVMISGVQSGDGEIVVTRPAPVCSSTCTCD